MLVAKTVSWAASVFIVTFVLMDAVSCFIVLVNFVCVHLEVRPRPLLPFFTAFADGSLGPFSVRVWHTNS